MTGQFNVRLPAKTRKQLENMRSWSGMNDTQLTIEAIDHLHQEYKREYETPIGWSAYRRDVNAGFVTQTILVENGMVLQSYEEATRPGQEPGEWPDLAGKTLPELRGIGFTRIKNEREVETIRKNYMRRGEDLEELTQNFR
jgi:hypothetical protein